jgi:hypothetical protein
MKPANLPGQGEGRRCPHCGRPLPEQHPAVLVDELRRFCRDQNLVIFAGDRVDENAASDILGKVNGTLRNWRTQALPLPFSRTGAGRGRIFYRLQDLADFMNRKDLCT